MPTYPDARPDVVGCEVSVSVRHPAVGVAHYAGAVSYLWHDGPRNASFDPTCLLSAAGAVCRDDYAPPLGRPESIPKKARGGQPPC